MALTIKEITDLIEEFDGEEKTLNLYIRNMEKLERMVAVNDMPRFLLVVQLKLKKKAAEAVNNIDPENFEDIKKALIDHIRPKTSVERAELKLSTAKQQQNEDTEKFAKRIKELLQFLNNCYEIDSDVLRKENERKAKRAFEDGLSNYTLRNRTTAANNKTLEEAINYAIEQDLRLNKQKDQSSGNGANNNYDNNSNRGNTGRATCFNCNIPGHIARDCKKNNSNRNNNRNNSNRTSFQQNLNRNNGQGNFNGNNRSNFGNNGNQTSNRDNFNGNSNANFNRNSNFDGNRNFNGNGNNFAGRNYNDNNQRDRNYNANSQGNRNYNNGNYNNGYSNNQRNNEQNQNQNQNRNFQNQGSNQNNNSRSVRHVSNHNVFRVPQVEHAEELERVLIHQENHSEN